MALSGCSKNPSGLEASLSTGHVHGDVDTLAIFYEIVFEPLVTSGVIILSCIILIHTVFVVSCLLYHVCF